MALSPTLVENFRTAYTDQFDKNEQTRPTAGALKCALEDTQSAFSFVTPDMIEKAKRSAGLTVKVPAINYDGTVSIGSTRPITITDDENTSALYSMVFVIYSGGFTMVPAQHSSNDISYQDDFNRKMRKMLYKMESTMDDAVLTKLGTVKNQVQPDSLGKYGWDSNIITIAKSDKETIYSDLEILMASKDLNQDGAPLNVIANPFVASQVKFLGAQGGGNQVNYAYQFDGKNFYWDNSISNAAGHDGTMYFMPKGSIGVVTRQETDALLNSKAGDGHEWSVVNLPILNMIADAYYYDGAYDSNALRSDLTRAYKQYFGFTVEMAILTPYRSATDVAADIMKAAILNS